MDFIITIDTEADNQWTSPGALTTENTRYIPRFQALCERFGFRPTYLCAHEMVTDPAFREMAGPYREQGTAEIGAHLHPWSTPPFDSGAPCGRYQAFPNELPLELFRQKMIVLTEAIRETFSRSPTSYRAGRYGFDASHIDVLLDLGYVVDCSVVPYTCYVDTKGMPGGAGGPDFRKARPRSYYLSREDCTRPGDSRLLEVPVTVLFPKWPMRSWPWMQQRWANHTGRLWARALHKFGLGPRWLRPWRHSTAKQFVDVYLAAQRLNLGFAEMMLHSSELMPGGSPTFPDQASIETLYGVLDKAFACIADDGARGKTLTEFARDYKREVGCRGERMA